MEITDITSENDFLSMVWHHFKYQATACEPYARYLAYLGVDYQKVERIEAIPFMPVRFFKTHRITSRQHTDICFTSSGTGNGKQAVHPVFDVSLYEKSFIRAFSLFYGNPADMNIYALLPAYLEREGSSLIYMVEKLIEKSHDGGFFLYDYDALVKKLEQRSPHRKTLLFGVSFALLDLAEKYELSLGDDVIVMETGGMKGRRRELPREELHAVLCNRLGVSSIHSEYGMCECLSQSYSFGEGRFVSPPWMRILIRDLHDPFTIIGPERRGGVNIIDLANYYSCSFLQTDDVGICFSDHSFKIEGRVDYSEIRGCNLLI